MRLLLLSNSTNFGRGYLDHAVDEIAEHFKTASGSTRRVLFVPFALTDQPGYWRKARDRFVELGLELDRLIPDASAPGAVRAAEGFFVGGGNTFRLLAGLQRCGALEEIRRRVLDGAPYMGASAGTVISAPTIRTTNDMPIVQPASLAALRLVPFQINCHYLDADAASKHMGETREQRLREFHEESDAENQVPVVGLREGAILKARRSPGAELTVSLAGTAGARIFRRGHPALEQPPGSSLDQILRA